MSLHHKKSPLDKFALRLSYSTEAFLDTFRKTFSLISNSLEKILLKVSGFYSHIEGGLLSVICKIGIILWEFRKIFIVFVIPPLVLWITGFEYWLLASIIWIIAIVAIFLYSSLDEDKEEEIQASYIDTHTRYVEFLRFPTRILLSIGSLYIFWFNYAQDIDIHVKKVQSVVTDSYKDIEYLNSSKKHNTQTVKIKTENVKNNEFFMGNKNLKQHKNTYIQELTPNIIRNIQTKLNKLGYYDGKIDGNYGLRTVSSLKKWMVSKGYKRDSSITKYRIQILLNETLPKNNLSYRPTNTSRVKKQENNVLAKSYGSEQEKTRKEAVPVGRYKDKNGCIHEPNGDFVIGFRDDCM